jgi:hypothetical protein
LFDNYTKKMRILLIGLFLLGAVAVWAKAPILTDKELSDPPSNVIRTCCAFGVDLSIARIPFIRKTDIISVQELGDHHYMGNHEEGNGIIYTRRGGFIDLGHLRDYADWTAYLYNLIVSSAESGEDVVLDLGSEGGTKTLILKSLQGLDGYKFSELAGRIAYDLSVWHEIATWFGTSYIPMVPERYSSFSPEDLYSNLLGVQLGMLAIQSDLEYNEAMTILLANTLDSLETVTSMEATYAAMEDVENIWWTRKKSLPSSKILLTRYLDAGPFLLPWLLPDDENDHPSYKLNKPDPALRDLYELSIKLNRKFPLMLLEEAGLNRTITQNDFRWLISYIEDDQRNSALKRSQKTILRNERKQHTAAHIKS